MNKNGRQKKEVKGKRGENNKKESNKIVIKISKRMKKNERQQKQR